MERDTKEGLEKLKQFRIEKMEALREAGVNPYPYKFDVTHTVEAVVAGEETLTKDETPVRVAGRIMAMRGHGKTSFGHIEDRTGRIQFYIRKDDIGDDRFRIFRMLEVGDIAGIEGVMFRTKTDELTVRIQGFEVLAKGLRPLPEKWHGLQDKELRYRQRYVDLLMNAEVREVFMTRTRIVEAIRQFLNQRGYLEVETPILQPLYGGAAARPFTTHHNSLDVDLYLRIADELYLKRLLVGGLERVFEFSKDFRNEGIDRTHFPEFTMMECYAAYEDYEDYMTMVEEMLEHAAKAVAPDGKVVYNGHTVDFTKTWKRVKFFDALEEGTGIDFRGLDEAAVFSAARDLKIDVEKGMPLARMLDDIFSECVEPKLLDPTFIYDYPKELSPLAKDHRSEPGLVERFEPFIGGFEIGNAFSELNDPLEQKRRFEAQAAARERGDEEAHMIDTDYVRALEYGMPPAAGLGIGIDRLTMVLTDSASIRDVLLFPQMRPE